MSLLSRADVKDILERYFLKDDRSEDIVMLTEPQPEVTPKVVNFLLSENKVHDEDYIVFKHFKDRATLILDVGANFGYSALGFWRVGAASSVAAFEPIKPFGAVLAELEKRVNEDSDQKKYEYYNIGLSDTEGELTFYSSVVNGRTQSALTTASKRPHIDSYVKTTFNWAERYMGGVTSFKMYSFTSPVTTLDKWLASGVSKLPTNHIIALKIDAEGYEGHILRGGQALLNAQQPLIIAESGHVIPLAVEIAKACGYVLAEREGDQLAVSDRPTARVNGFFVHPDKFPYYKEIGLMKD